MNCRVLMLRAFLAVVCVLATATWAPAQIGSGSLHGRVVDSGGAAVSGARVTIAGPLGDQSQTTDIGGRFRFLSLAPGSYSVKVEREGITPTGHPSVTVRLGRSTVIQLTATPGGHQMLGGAESALLDPRVVATGVNMRQEFLELLPFAQDLSSVIQSTPGVLLDLVSVGGSGTGDRPSLVFRGAPRDANTWSVDGVTLTDMSAPGLAPRYFEFGLLEEIQTVTGGSEIRQMTAGLGVNLVTKSGANLAQRQARAAFSNGMLFKNDVQPLGGSRLEGAMEFGAEAGGAITRDKLWYFAGFDGVGSDRETLAANEIASHDFTKRSLVGKINWRAASHGLTAAFHTSGIDRDGEGASPFRAPSAVWDENGRTTVLKAEDSTVVGAKLFVNGLVGFTDMGYTLNPAGDGATRFDAAGVFRDGFQRVNADRTSGEVRLNVSTYFGEHEWQAGLGYRAVSADSLYEWPSGVVTLASDTPVTLLILPPDRDVSAKASYTSAFIQDTFTHGNLTANLGLRFDVQRGRNRQSEGIANPASALVPAVTFAGDDESLSWASVVPRLGVTYALGRDRTTLGTRVVQPLSRSVGDRSGAPAESARAGCGP